MINQFTVNVESKSVVIDETAYRWTGMMTGILCSIERGRNVGDVRAMGDLLFKVSRIETRGWLLAPEVLWVPVEQFDETFVKRLRCHLMLGNDQ